MSLAKYNISLTYEQFMGLAESIITNTGYKTEYANGEIIYFSPNARHGKIIRNMCNILESKLPNTCFVANEFHIKFREKEYRVPDISVYCGKDIKDKFEKDILHLEMPKLVIEVLSESTEDNDKKYKKEVYSLSGIEEYLIVDYKNNTIEQYYLNNENYELNRNYNNKETCTLLLYPNVNFVVSDIFKMFSNG